MEIVGAFVDEEWDSLSKMFSENPDSFDLHYDGEIPFLPTSDHHHSFNTNFCSNAISQESSNNGEIETTHFLDEDFIHDYNHGTNNTFDESMSFYNMDGSLMMMMPVFPDHVMEEILHSKGENRAPETGDDSKLKRTYDQDVSENHSHDSSPKKVPRVSRNAQKNSRKNKKKIQEANNEEEGNKQCSSNCSSEDDSNDSKTKTKASRGSATDPQSLYARRRRERINERLKILQNLVPNGTKVDISTMLEEAVQYVKFLQLQIKLLSSDDMWMYAPLAYNGMDLGIYHNISPNLTAHN